MWANWGLSAGEFLAAYATLALVPVVVQLVSPRVLRRRSATAGYRPTLLELAVLAGGPLRAGETVLADLLERGFVRADSAGRLVTVVDRPRTTHWPRWPGTRWRSAAARPPPRPSGWPWPAPRSSVPCWPSRSSADPSRWRTSPRCWRNLGTDPAAFLDEVPLDRLAYVHVAGGIEVDGIYHDTHTHPVLPEVLGLLGELRHRAEPPGALLERDGDYPRDDDLAAELAAIRERL